MKRESPSESMEEPTQEPTAQPFSGVPSMFDSLEVKVLYPT
jgi:hypothetical protein